MNDVTQSPAAEAITSFRARVRGLSGDLLDLETLEVEVRGLVEAVGRELMVEVLRRADVTAPEVEVHGQVWSHRRVLPGEYECTFGTLNFERSVFQRSGRGRVLVPLELRAGIVERRYTPKMARVMTRTIAVTTEEEGAELLAEIGVAKVSSSTLSRIPRAIAARHELRREELDRAVREQELIPEAAVTVQAALDGVMVPQDGEHARARGRTTDEPEPPRHERRYGPVGVDAPAANDGHAGRAWHEASVGTLAFFDGDGRRLKTIYLGRMPEPHKATLVAQVNAELMAVLAERPEMNVVLASDGAAPHWEALDALATRIAPICTGRTVKLLDAFHAAEYVQLAANAIEGLGTGDAAIRAATWRETLKQRDDGAAVVLRSMRALGPSVRSATRRKELATAIAYIANQAKLGRMRYADALAHHFPIGTGITEAAAKTVVGTRMKRAGARFSQHGGQTVMLFRTAILSGRFDALHTRLTATYAAAVKFAA